MLEKVCDGYSMELYFVSFAACNTGISLLLYSTTAVSSSKIKKIQRIKSKNSHISSYACVPTPTFLSFGAHDRSCHGV